MGLKPWARTDKHDVIIELHATKSEAFAARKNNQTIVKIDHFPKEKKK